MKVVDFDGTVLDATFSVLPPEPASISVIFESSGGHAGGPNPRNLQYRQGLNVILTRLQTLNAVVDEIRVETERTRMLPVEQQRIDIPNRPFPVALATAGEVDSFRLEISRAGRKVGQSPELAADSGGSSRRLRIHLSGVPLAQESLEKLLVGEGAEPDSSAVVAVVEIAAGRSKSGGQGFLLAQVVRKAVEEHAVLWAIRHYASLGWKVQNVGSTQSYDLKCLKDAEERHVEVKGTTGMGETVILTRNEVMHAKEWFPAVDLFVVTEIRVAQKDGSRPLTSGGVAQVFPHWRPAEQDLIPFGFDYSTGLNRPSERNEWLPVDPLAPA